MCNYMTIMFSIANIYEDKNQALFGFFFILYVSTFQKMYLIDAERI